MTAQPLIKSERGIDPLTVDLPDIEEITLQSVADYHLEKCWQALGESEDKFGRTWDDSAVHQRARMLVLSGQYVNDKTRLGEVAALGWVDLPALDRERYKDVMTAFLKYVFRHGLVSGVRVNVGSVDVKPEPVGGVLNVE